MTDYIILRTTGKKGHRHLHNGHTIYRIDECTNYLSACATQRVFQQSFITIIIYCNEGAFSRPPLMRRPAPPGDNNCN